MKTRRLPIALLSLASLVGLTAHAEVIPFDVEVGYRWLDVGGNTNMYRSQINEKSGFLLRSFNMAAGGDGSSLYDRFIVDASDVGVGPASSIRIRSEKQETYKLDIKYRYSAAFSALPEFANPLLDSGVTLGQHTYDRHRTLFDADLELMPGHRFTPILGYSMNRYSGPGTTTYHAGQDEFLLDSNLNDVDHEYRLGVGFELGSWNGTVTQGWRKAHTEESLSLAPNAGGGNEPGPILGQDQTVTKIARTDDTSVSTPFTNAVVSGQYKRVRLVGNYVHLAANSDGTQNETVNGTLASFELNRFFSGLAQTATSSARNQTDRGGARAEMTIFDTVDVFAGYQSEHREIDGTALLNTLYSQTVDFGGLNGQDIQTVLNAKSSMDRKEHYLNGGASARLLGPFSVRGEFRVTKQEVTVAPDLSEIVVPGPSQGGDFSREIKTLDLDGAYANHGFLLGAAYRKDNADEPIFRTDYRHRDRLRLRAGWKGLSDRLKLGLVSEGTNQDNDDATISFDNKIRQWSGDVSFVALKELTLHGSLSRFRSDSTILYRVPQTFEIGDSLHRENGEAKEGGLTFTHAAFSVDANYSRLNNSGTNPFNVDRTRLRLSYDFKPTIGVIAEYDQDKYSEDSSIGDFDAKRYGIYLHYRP